MTKDWFSVAMLSAEAQQVVWLRWMKLAAGGAAARTEANLMVSEKVAAAGAAALLLGRGGKPASVIGVYRRKVRANARRLLKA
jgi:hypothetical protein